MGDTKQEREMKGEKKSPPPSFSHILSVRLSRGRSLDPFLSRWIVIRVRRGYAPPNADGNCTGNKPSAFFNRRAGRATTSASGGPLHAQRDADVNVCPRYDIYFIGVSLPSSMMIYNCCSLGCNYYNYRFFVRGPRNRAPAWPGPGPGRPLRSIPLDAAPPLWSFISRVPRPPFPLYASLPLSLFPSVSLLSSLSRSLAVLSISRTETRSTAAPT